MKDKHRVESLKQLLKFDAMKATALLPPKMEDWCCFHNLVHSSLNHVSEICKGFIVILSENDTINSLQSILITISV